MNLFIISSCQAITSLVISIIKTKHYAFPFTFSFTKKRQSFCECQGLGLRLTDGPSPPLVPPQRSSSRPEQPDGSVWRPPASPSAPCADLFRQRLQQLETQLAPSPGTVESWVHSCELSGLFSALGVPVRHANPRLKEDVHCRAGGSDIWLCGLWILYLLKKDLLGF